MISADPCLFEGGARQRRPNSEMFGPSFFFSFFLALSERAHELGLVSLGRWFFEALRVFGGNLLKHFVRRTLKTVAKCNFFTWQICHLAGATISPLRARRTSKTVAKRKFLTCFCNPFVTSCWSDVQNCGSFCMPRAAI